MSKFSLIVSICLLAVLVCGSGLMTACSSDSGFNDLVGLAKMAPEHLESITFINVKSFRSDKDLNEIYNDMKEGFAEVIISGKTGVEIEDVEYISYS